ncbi:MAG: DNA-binding transcriptional LysR family regulator [Gammaproteobacteria bacterium]|jgi:DNA-binding transcriptional LysR family regulator
MDKWAELSAFVAVVDHEGFAPAARTQQVSPSGISRLVSNLEDRLGVRLLNRTMRRISLTEAGERLFAHGKSILSEFRDAEAEVTNLSSTPRGRLRVSCMRTLAERQMGPIFADFMVKYPDISLDIREHAHPHELVAESVDVALITGELDSSSHIIRSVAKFKRLICAAPAYLQAHRVPAKPQDLKNHNCLEFGNNSQRQRWRFHDGNGAIEEHWVTGRLRASTADTILPAALAGIGICRLANFVVGPHLQTGELVELFGEDVVADDVPFAIVYTAKRHLAPKVRVFIDHVVDVFTPLPPWSGIGSVAN